MLDDRKHQFISIFLIVIMIGFLNYFRRILNGMKLNSAGKMLYLVTMVIFATATMFILYFTQLNNVVSFVIGIFVTTLSEHIANFLVKLGDNFENIIVKIIAKKFGVDLTSELINKKKENENDEIDENNTNEQESENANK